MHHHVYTLTQSNNSLPLQLSDTMIFVKDDNLILNLVGSTNDTISVYGRHATVFLDMGATGNMSVQVRRAW